MPEPISGLAAVVAANYALDAAERLGVVDRFKKLVSGEGKHGDAVTDSDAFRELVDEYNELFETATAIERERDDTLELAEAIEEERDQYLELADSSYKQRNIALGLSAVLFAACVGLAVALVGA
jgi:hypothetical protein